MSLHDYLTAAKEPGGLSIQAMQEACDIILTGKAPPVDIAALLWILCERGETTDEVTGLTQSLRRHANPFSAPDTAIDLCGTGGDGRHTPNISTAAAFVVAGCGVPVVKHGNRAISSKAGSADVMEALGVKIDPPPELSSKALAEANICFLYAPLYHPAMRHAAEARGMLGRRTIFNLAGPLANPAQPKRQLLGVFHKNWLRPLAEILHRLGGTAAWTVHSRDGMDEISTMDVTDVIQMLDGSIAATTIDPDDYELVLHDLHALRGGDAIENAAMLNTLLMGATGALHDIVVLNAAAALVVAGHSPDLQQAINAAKTSIAEGRAAAALAQLIKISNG